MPYNPVKKEWEINPDQADWPIPTTGHLAVFLGGSHDSFTGMLLGLFQKADPGNHRKLADAFPREDEALHAWGTLQDPTFARLAHALNNTASQR